MKPSGVGSESVRGSYSGTAVYDYSCWKGVYSGKMKSLVEPPPLSEDEDDDCFGVCVDDGLVENVVQKEVSFGELLRRLNELERERVTQLERIRFLEGSLGDKEDELCVFKDELTFVSRAGVFEESFEGWVYVFCYWSWYVDYAPVVREGVDKKSPVFLHNRWFRRSCWLSIGCGVVMLIATFFVVFFVDIWRGYDGSRGDFISYAAGGLIPFWLIHRWCVSVFRRHREWLKMRSLWARLYKGRDFVRFLAMDRQKGVTFFRCYERLEKALFPNKDGYLW